MTPFTVESRDIVLAVPGFTTADLYRPDRLRDLYDTFCEEVAAASPAFAGEWDKYRANPDAAWPPTEVSRLLVAMSRHVSGFLARLFGVEEAAEALSQATHRQDELFRFKVEFVRRRVVPALRTGDAHPTADDQTIVERLVDATRVEDVELAVARAGCALLDREAALGRTAGDTSRAAATAGQAAAAPPDPEAASEQRDVALAIEALKKWCAVRLHDPAYRGWVTFRFPETLDYHGLVPLQRARPDLPETATGPDSRLRRRDGFTLTDRRMNGREVLSELHYCVLCHERDKDSCSKGYRGRDGKPARNPLGIELAGCPLDEKISEMHAVRRDGDAIGALALVMLDNPMCPGTGHRICNDCMKACIYQKQDPVDIPQAETGVLTDVLKMPWGVEIYGLLTRWNPLNVRRPYALPYNGKNVMVVGLGPAGYTLAHYLLNEGFGVVGVDGLKIEPLPADLTGADGRPPRPVRDWSEIYRHLDDRVLEGFGGVSEYGITVRWDKNFLTLVHLVLARRDRFRVYGGVRFGGTIPLEEAWTIGFDHVAIAAGAGRPTIIDIRNNLIRGVRKASDFLMALQLTGAFKRSAFANLQVRLPAVVIGGGLTAIDTATELMAYYPLQVEKMLDRYETLAGDVGEDRVRAMYDEEELLQLDEFLAHGRAVRAERARADAARTRPDFIRLVRQWGGVSIVYRKRLLDSPAYRLNHEEVIKSLEEGIAFVENLNPEEAVPDEFSHVKAMQFRRQELADGKWIELDETVELPARSVLVAAGTSPNVTYEKEYPGTFQLDARRRFFEPHRAVPAGNGFRLEPAADGFFTSYVHDGHFVSYYGDNHPLFAGNVVKAMASAKKGYPEVVKLFARDLAALEPEKQGERDVTWNAFVSRLDADLLAQVVEVRRLTPTIVEVVVHAPAAARHFQPGQFYRLQNYEVNAKWLAVHGLRTPDSGPRTSLDTRLVMEGIALTGAWVDRERGLLSLITLELGVSSRLCAYLQPGEPVVVMGPTGAPTEIPRRQGVLLAGGGLGNAVLFSIARALKDNGNRVIYFAAYKRGEDLFKREEIEAATDQVIWSTDTGDTIEPHRPQDAHFRGNIVQAMLAYSRGTLGRRLVPLDSVDRVIAIGSDRMMAAVKGARYGVLQPYLKREHVAIASINSPMQCMMKEVCAQCLQKHVDPATGQETIIFSCFNQDQYMDRVDFFNLNARLRQNTVQEKLAGLWLDRLLAAHPLDHV
jgi:NADPH-dependent glutamate synthase beta subunit-like oxidoreductase/NAD(P)H-flavin reductase